MNKINDNLDSVSYGNKNVKTDKELIEEFEKDEGIHIQEVELFGNYEHKIGFSGELNENDEIECEYIRSIDNIELKTPILINRYDNEGNGFNYKNEKIKDGNNSKPTESHASRWLHSKIHESGCHEEGNRCNTYVGKWLIFVSPENIDNIWEKVKETTDKRLLGIGSKVSTKRQTEDYGEKQFVICIYTKDYRNKEDVKNVLQELRKIGIDGRLYYKSDSMTSAGIYSKEGPLTTKKGKSSLYCSTDFETRVINNERLEYCGW